MRSRLFLLFITLLSTIAAQAQKQEVRKRPDWGIKTGVNFSTLMMDESDNRSRTWRTGFAAGFFFRIKAGSDIYIQPEFLFSSMGGNFTDAINTTYRINYFSVPLLVKYHIKNKLAIVAGPQADILFQAREMTSRLMSERITANYKDYSINATAGIEYWPFNDIGLSARYIHGLTDITKDPGSVKNQGVQVTLAVKL